MVRIVVFPSILSPPSDSRLLADTMRSRGLAKGADVLDVFTGSGVLAIAAALTGARMVTATDISRWAVLNTRFNTVLNRARVRALCGDLFSPVVRERFDLILANPPYLPGAGGELPSGGAALAWEGGVDGRVLIDRLCEQAPDHLTPGGTLLLVHSSLCGEEITLERLASKGIDGDTVARRRGPLGPVTSGRARLLEDRGLIGSEEREEELIVIQGIRC